ncbi:MAG TPA: Gfo/Idh/MocA family oxidoreductase [Opitutaceae bacterium]|nr:Gfo/Idh/MocA family oxidoreductase [Opitutaceae bacterium]
MRKTLRRVRLAIIGAGGMANTHVKLFRDVPGCVIVAAVDVDPKRVADFCERHTIANAFTDVGELLATVEFDAVSIVTTDATHEPLSIRFLRAGKHVLCEKPLALDHAGARRMLAAARESGRVHMVNLSYRNIPALHAAAKLIAKGGLGELRHVEASYLQSWLLQDAWGDWHTQPGWLWRLSKRHGSKGALGDIGVHLVDYAMFPAGPITSVSARLKVFPKAPRGRIGPYVLDANDSAIISAEFANGALGTLHTTRWSGGHHNRLFIRISGTRGSIEIDPDLSTEHYRICRGPDLKTTTWRKVKAPKVPNVHRRFITSIRTGKPERPDFSDGAAAQAVLDAAFESDSSGRTVNVRRST